MDRTAQAIRDLIVYVLIIAGAGFLAVGAHVHASAAPRAAVCRFDGGGAVTAGNAARTSDGRVWLCTDDGRLAEVG